MHLSRPAPSLKRADRRTIIWIAVALAACVTLLVGANLWRTHSQRMGQAVRLAIDRAEVHYAADRALHTGGQPFGQDADHGWIHVYWKGLPGARGRAAPDHWESVAFARGFEKDNAKAELQVTRGSEHLRWIQPLRDEASCHRCHETANPPGALRGGVSILVPMERIAAVSRESWKRQLGFHLVSWLLGLGGLALGTCLLLSATAERDRITSDLQAALEATETILENVPFGMALVDRRKYVRQINKYAEQLIGKPRSEIVGKVCTGNFCPSAKNACPILDLNQKVDSTERRVLNAEKESIPVLKTVIPIRWRDEDMLLEAFVDISEQRNTMAEQKAALEEEQRLGRLTVDRELRMRELKEEINSLLVGAGCAAKYSVADDDADAVTGDEVVSVAGSESPHREVRS